MYQKNICINTNTGIAFSTGNQGYRKLLKSSTPTPDDVRRAVYKCSILERSDTEVDDNYNVWSRSVKRDGLNFFFVVTVKAETKKEFEAQEKKILTDNGWKGAHEKTFPTKPQVA